MSITRTKKHASKVLSSGVKFDHAVMVELKVSLQSINVQVIKMASFVKNLAFHVASQPKHLSRLTSKVGPSWFLQKRLIYVVLARNIKEQKRPIIVILRNGAAYIFILQLLRVKNDSSYAANAAKHFAIIVSLHVSNESHSNMLSVFGKDSSPGPINKKDASVAERFLRDCNGSGTFTVRPVTSTPSK